MSDTQRSRRPASRSPRGSRQSTQLGELEFSDWYEIPVFEPDEDELTEEIATSGRGPRRLVARAKIARDARRAKRRPEWDAPARRSAVPAPPASAPASEKAAAEPASEKAAPEPAAARAAEPTRQVESAPGPAEKPVPAEKPEPAEVPARAEKPVPAPAPAPKPAPVPVPAMAQARDEDTWVTSGPALTEESMRLDLERESVWRRRINDFLDRWAAKEVAAQRRLDDSIEQFMDRNLPKSIPDLLAAATKRGGSR